MSSPPQSHTLASLRPWVERFAGRRILVWGDLVADRFLYGTTTRVSREAPALVLRHQREEIRPGAAGNAALNAAALGASVAMFGYLGEDPDGLELERALAQAGVETAGITKRDDGVTPVKTRVMAGGFHTVHQQILRIDNDRAWPSSDLHGDLVEAVRSALSDADALLISDYGIGTTSPSLYEGVRAAALAAGIPVALDSRFRVRDYRGVTVATPNEREVEEALRVRLNSERGAIEEAGARLLGELQSDHLLITRGSCGMVIFGREAAPIHLPIHGTDEIADVTGAGDTVIATLSLALAAGADVATGASLANVAAGLVVMKHGTATVPRDELLAALEGSG